MLAYWLFYWRPVWPICLEEENEGEYGPMSQEKKIKKIKRKPVEEQKMLKMDGLRCVWRETV